MLIENGMYYRLSTGEVVRVQTEQGGFVAAYNVAGDRVHHAEPDDHVNGWEPVGVVDWNKAREAHKAELAAQKESRKKPAKKSGKKSGKEESSEEAKE